MKYTFAAARLSLVAVASLALVSCATGTGSGSGGGATTDTTYRTKPAASKAPPAAQKELRGAQANIRSGENKKAVFRLSKLAKQNPDTDVAGNAEMLMANLYFTQGNFAESLTHYQAVMNGPATAHEAAARLGVARCLNKLGRHADAAKIIADANSWPNVTAEQTSEINKLRIEILTSEQDYVGALAAAVAVSKEQGQEYFDATRFTPDQLRAIAGDSKFGAIQPLARYRYALILADQKDYSGARDELQAVARAVSGTELADRATRFVQQIDARNKVDPRTVGVILPLSGPNSGIGYKALRGVQLGLGIYGENKSNFRLAVADSEGNVDGARRAVERLVQEDNVIAIIGGLQSKTATVEAARAQEFGVPTVMLSQKSGITAAGESIFRNALTSQMQVAELVNVAMKQLGFKTFAIMYPNDAYGTEYANLFWDEVKSHGGEIRGAQIYDPKETDFRSYVQRLTGTFYLDDRAEELRIRQADYAQKNPKKALRNSGPLIEDILPPIVDFDAIFIPDEARAVGQIAPALAYDNVKGVKLLGTNIWNSPRFLQRGQKFVEGAIFVDSILTNDPAFTSSQFFTSFKSAFNDDPGLTEVQAYDSALIIRQLISKGETTRIGLQQAMAGLQNFPGALGPLSVTPDREIRRPVTAFTVTKGQFTPFEQKQQ